MRITQVLKNGKLETISFRSLREGDIFRLIDKPKDGGPVYSDGSMLWYCCDTPVLNENNVYQCNAKGLEETEMRAMWIGDKVLINKPETPVDSKEATFWGVDNLAMGYGDVKELKPDVVFRFVYHVDCPDGGEGYYDQIQLKAGEFMPIDKNVFVPGIMTPPTDVEAVEVAAE